MGINLSNTLFIDIETVSQQSDYEKLDSKIKKLWDKKASLLGKDGSGSTPETLYERAGIYAEFGKIICISAGMFTDSKRFYIKSYFGDDEKSLLNDFATLLKSGKIQNLCAHNGKEFDFPYIARRMLVNGIQIPHILDTRGKKPWETSFIDTMELWKFGDYKNYTSLELLCAVFDIPTPKDDIDGSKVGEVYWKAHDLNRIRTYCQKDVVAVAQLMRRYNYAPLIPEADIVFAN